MALTVDLDRLHKNYEIFQREKGSGKTFAACHDLLGTLEVGENQEVVCLVFQYRDVGFIVDMFKKILEISYPEQTIKKIQQFEYEIFGKRIKFISKSVSGWEDRLECCEFDLVDFEDRNTMEN